MEEMKQHTPINYAAAYGSARGQLRSLATFFDIKSHRAGIRIDSSALAILEEMIDEVLESSESKGKEVYEQTQRC